MAGRVSASESNGVPSERSESRGTYLPFVYILRCADGTFYVGHTADLQFRVALHNAGIGVAYTARRRPVRVIAATVT